MHTEVEFQVNPKTDCGKGSARQTRAGGQVPGIVYGHNLIPTMVSFEERELKKALSTPAGRNVFLRLKCDNPELNGARTLIKELQVHPLLRRFIHADFFKLDPDRAIHAMVPIRLMGASIGVKLGGIMQIAMRDMPVLCKPDDLPEAIEVQVAELKIGQSIHVSEIKQPEGVEFLASGKMAICAVISPSAEEEGTKKEGETTAAAGS